MVVHTLHSSILESEAGDLCEFKASLMYTASSRPALVRHSETLSQTPVGQWLPPLDEHAGSLRRQDSHRTLSILPRFCCPLRPHVPSQISKKGDDPREATHFAPFCVSVNLAEISGTGQAGWRVHYLETSGMSFRARSKHHPLPVHCTHLQRRR